MMSDGYLVGDGSWNLRVFVTDLQVERSLRVKGDLHIGGVMLRLVEDLGELHVRVCCRSTCFTVTSLHRHGSVVCHLSGVLPDWKWREIHLSGSSLLSFF